MEILVFEKHYNRNTQLIKYADSSFPKQADTKNKEAIHHLFCSIDVFSSIMYVRLQMF